MQEEIEYLSVKDVERLTLAAQYCAHPERNSCMIQMCFLHGFRINEITALTLSDVDFPGKRIYIHRARHGVSGYHPWQPKEVISLQRWLLARECYPAHSDLLFLSSRGNKMTRQRFYQIIRECCELARLKQNVHPRMLRHACGYELGKKGIDDDSIQDYLGYRNLKSILRYNGYVEE